MGAAAGAVRYRPNIVVRLVPPGAGLVALGCWGVVMVRTDDLTALPVVVVLSALISVAAWFGWERAVVLTPDALIMRSYRGTTTFAWSDIGTLQRRLNTIWVMTADGWFALPLPGTTRPPRDRSEVRPLGDEVWVAWLDRRGTDWMIDDLRPWRPNRDLRGRAVLRPPILTRITWFVPALYPLLATMIPIDPRGSSPLLDRIVFGLAFFAVVALPCLAYHRWSRVTIDERHVVVRSLSGVTRFERDRVIGITEVRGRRGGGRARVRLAIGIRQPIPDLPAPSWWRPTAVIPLVAPTTADNWQENDPAYYRTWTWLHDELVATTGSRRGRAERTAASTDHHRET